MYFVAYLLLIADTLQAFARQQAPPDSTPAVQQAEREASLKDWLETAYVTAVDTKGKPVTDLRREDFSISES